MIIIIVFIRLCAIKSDTRLAKCQLNFIRIDNNNNNKNVFPIVCIVNVELRMAFSRLIEQIE